MSFGVAVNGRFLTRRATGVDRFALELLRAWLPRFGGNHSIRMVMPTRPLPFGEPTLVLPKEAVGRLTGHAWEQLELSAYCRNEMLVSLCNTGPIAHRHQLAVLHDAGAIANAQSYGLAFRTWYQWLFAGLMRRALTVATVSEFSASELMRHFGGRARSIEVIPESGEHILRAASDSRILRRLNLGNSPYILAVGSRAPHKNFGVVVRAAQLLGDVNIKVVVAGGSNKSVFAGMGLSADNLVLAGYVSDGELRALYEHAHCFVFPSLYEGFGLPPLEAMHCGCPVVVSRCASMPEVCGDAALYFDPLDPEDLARQIRRVIASEALRQDLRAAGHARSRHFSWGRTAATFNELLQLSCRLAAA